MSTTRAVRESLVAIARRYSRVAHEVEDIAHDVIVSALRRGFPLDGDAFLRSAHGAARRHAAFLARTASRRRAREAADLPDPPVATIPALPEHPADEAFATLSPGLRTTLLLLGQGLEKAELRLVLGLSDAALRKRFQALRERVGLERPSWTVPPRTPALSQLRRSQVAFLPRLAAAWTGKDPSRDQPLRALAVADPDGHGLIFVEALTPDGPTATSHALANVARTPTKGSPCSPARSRTSRSSS